MNYMSPIDVMAIQTRMAYEDGILKAVRDVGIIVEKEELEKALAYDRNQYSKGFADAKESLIDRVLEVIDEEQKDQLKRSNMFQALAAHDALGCLADRVKRLRGEEQ